MSLNSVKHLLELDFIREMWIVKNEKWTKQEIKKEFALVINMVIKFLPFIKGMETF